MISIRRVARAIVANISTPVCGGCAVYGVNCVNWCGKSAQERRRCYIAQSDIGEDWTRHAQVITSKSSETRTP